MHLRRRNRHTTGRRLAIGLIGAAVGALAGGFARAHRRGQATVTTWQRDDDSSR